MLLQKRVVTQFLEEPCSEKNSHPGVSWQCESEMKRKKLHPVMSHWPTSPARRWLRPLRSCHCACCSTHLLCSHGLKHLLKQDPHLLDVVHQHAGLWEDQETTTSSTTSTAATRIKEEGEVMTKQNEPSTTWRCSEEEVEVEVEVRYSRSSPSHSRKGSSWPAGRSTAAALW